MRSKFDEQLEALHIELIKMGCLCETAIANASKALENPDESIIKAISEIENDIDHKERDIEGLCMRLILQQQPVATDLRLVSAAMKRYQTWNVSAIRLRILQKSRNMLIQALPATTSTWSIWPAQPLKW